MSDDDDKSDPETLARPEEEASRLKSLAEEAYTSGNINAAVKHAERAHKLHPSMTGLLEMLTAFRILRTATEPVSEVEKNPILDYYEILGVEQFSHINTIKKQYRKLAMTLHPDKNPFVASEEAFKLVGEAAQVLSDSVRRKEYDTRLRVALQSRVSQESRLAEEEQETFWTVCSTCQLMHKFGRKYLGQNLMCPSCKKTFKATEVEDEEGRDSGLDLEQNGSSMVQTTRVSARIKERVARGDKVGIVEKYGLGVKRKLGRAEEKGEEDDEDDFLLKNLVSKRIKKVVESGEDGNGGENQGAENGLRWRTRDGMEKVLASGSDDEGGVGNGSKRSRRIWGELRDGIEMVESDRAKRAKAREEGTMTLSQMRMLAKKKKSGDGEGAMRVTEVGTQKHRENNKGKEIQDDANGKVVENEEGTSEVEMDGNHEKQKKAVRERIQREKKREEENGKVKEVEYTREKKQARRRVSKYRNWETLSLDNQLDKLTSKKKGGGNLEVMPVEESEFHNFDADRTERSFKKGQVWAVYDDKDGMPRQYTLIDKIASLNPFQVILSWLQVHTGESTTQPCGRFKISNQVSIKYLNLFSHVVDCERSARQAYRIYPKKGSIWAVYGDFTGPYNIVVCLSSYSDVHGLSVGHLEKVPGFRTVFKRRAIGANAVVCLGKDGVETFSHQIPAKKLLGEELAGLDKDCWELDPAALPPGFLLEG